MSKIGFFIDIFWLKVAAGRRNDAFPKFKLVSVVGLIGFAMLLFQQAVFAQQMTLSAAARKQLKELEKPIILRGDYFRAVQVAYEDFSHELANKESGASSLDADSAKLVHWLARIENYDIYVDQSASSYIVQFDVTMRNHAPPVFGGGARYTIDRTTFAVTEKVGLK